MREFFTAFWIVMLSVTASFASDISALELSIIEYAVKHQDTAYEYFLLQIESGATPEEQAVYLYGMGRVNEAKGNVSEAINDYMAAEILGNESASRALIRLRKNNKED